MNELIDKIGPYRVEDRLGVGGMGEVYKAYDDRLDRWVAIKRIRPDKENADDNRERFQREAKATAQLNHNSIVHLYDIFQEGESDCIVMEYVEGRTLDTLVVQGPLDAQLVINLGYEIASGLAEAHSKGIVHRDLKVENIIITPDNHAKILDFGLAKPILSNELDDSLTGKGQLVGTSRAMSPEYVSGEDIDHRSDIFSFGVLLYEAATGHSPFKAHNTLATLKQVMLHAQTPACQLNSLVPVELSDLIDRMLEKAPDDRPQNAEEVAVALNDLRASFSSGSTIRPRFSGSTASLRRESGTFGSFSASATAIEQLNKRPALWILMFLIPVILGGSIVAWLQSHDSGEQTEGQNTEKDLIVIADFENRTEESMFDGAVDYAFRVDLERSKHARVLSDAQVEKALQRMALDPEIPIDIEVGREICIREGAKALVIGTLIKFDPFYQLTGTVIDPTDGSTRFTETIKINQKQASEEDGGIISAVGEITQAIRVHLGESLRQIEETPSLERVTTSNLRALRAYTTGANLMGDRNYDEAIRYFSAALEQDPEFAMAYGKLAALNITFKGDFAKGLEFIDQALALADRLTEYEEHYLRGWEANLRGDAEDVAQAWSLVSTLFPDGAAGHRNTGMAYYTLLNRFEDAAVFFSKAAAIPGPNQSVSYWNLGNCYLALGQTEKALESFHLAGEQRYWESIALVHIVRGEPSKAEALIDANSEDARAKPPKAQYLTTLGNLQEALRIAEDQRTQPGNRIIHTTLSILALEQVLQTPDFESTYREALGLVYEILDAQTPSADLPVGFQSIPFTSVALIGKVGARNGFIEESQELLERLVDLEEGKGLPLWTSHVELLKGEILMASGTLDVAISHLERSLSLAESFQARESLAKAFASQPNATQAITHYQRLLEQMGRSLVECRDGCEIIQLTDWTLAHYRLGRVYETNGDTSEAISLYEDFLELWSPEGSELQVVTDARERLERLQTIP